MSTPAVEPRDWIAVDQLLQALLSKAPDDFEREVIQLAAETSAGPHPKEPHGGNEWTAALAAARTQLQADLVRELDEKNPVIVDDQPAITAEIAAALEHIDLDDYTRDRLTESLAELTVQRLGTTRDSERAVIADWLMARAERLTTPHSESVIAEHQARALSSAAARLHNPNGHDSTDPNETGIDDSAIDD